MELVRRAQAKRTKQLLGMIQHVQQEKLDTFLLDAKKIQTLRMMMRKQYVPDNEFSVVRAE